MPTLTPIATRRLNPPQDNLWDALLPALPPLKDGDIFCITSKIVSIHQGRCISEDGTDTQKDTLTEQEASATLPRSCSRYDVRLTITNHALMPNAGLDESNANGHYILLPKNPFETAKSIHQKLCKEFNLKNLGIILTDSHTTPMRWGTIGLSMGFWGFNPLRDYREKPDLYGRALEFSQSNMADSLAAAAVNVMGEGAESTPVVLIRDWPNLTFSDKDFQKDFLIDPADDIYAPLLEKFKS